MRQASARESSEVAGLVRLHHRRRGWAWVAVGSLTGLVGYTVIGANLFDNLTGTAEVISVIPVFALLALVPVGLVSVIVDTVRIRRADAALRVTARDSVSHYPLYAHAHRYPPRHLTSWVFGLIMLVAMTGANVPILPAEVNAVAYVAGAESQDTFNPLSYGQACGKSGCHTVTKGYLSNSGASVTWGGQVPLGQPFTVRDPVWAWGTGRSLISSTGPATAVIVVGLVSNAVAAATIFSFVTVMRHRLSLRRKGMIVPAGAQRAHHPDLP